VLVRVHLPEADEWAAAARREDRSLAAFVRVAVREHLRSTRGPTGNDGELTPR